MKNPLMLSQEDIAQIKMLYLSKTKLHVIEQMTGIPLSRIKKVVYNPENRIFRRYKVYAVRTTHHLPSLPTQIRNRINVLTNFGYSPGEISEDLGVSKRKVIKEINYLMSANKIKREVCNG
jgi:predicted transcriptional regulator